MLFSQPNRYYTFRYLFALSIIAFLAILNYAITYYYIQKEADIMPTLQMSSEQKILSQQMSHWSLEMVLTKDEQEKKRLKDTLFVSLRKLNTNYRKLSQDADEMAKDLIQDEKILKMYRSRPLNIDLHLETFQDTIMGLLNLRTTQISSLEKEYISIIKNLANNKLWNGFDAVLKEYNNSSKQRIDKVQNVSFKISLAINTL